MVERTRGEAENAALDAKLRALEERIAEFESVAVALSGGIDSTLLLHVCRRVLGPERVLAVTSTSVTTPAPDLADAGEAASSTGVEHLHIETHELEIPEYSENSPSRCYFCKDELYSRVLETAKSRGIAVAVDGANVDDEGDHRPGMKAAAGQGIVSPLREAGLTKDDVRALAKRFDVPIWDKPASACLSSRFPYGTRIEREDVERVGAAEAVLRELGFVGGRVRHHGDTARIEIAPERIAALADPAVREAVVAGLKTLGYKYVSLDLEGYRSGSLNEVLPKTQAFDA